MFRSRTLTLFALAVLLGTGAVWVANRWVLEHMQPVAAAAADTSPIVVAALEIPFGQKVEAAQIKAIAWPKTNLPAQSYTDTKDVVGKVTTQTIYPGEVMLESRIREHLGGSTLSALITPTMRALTVRVNDVAGVAGFLLPGNRVDVLATRREGNAAARTRTVLEDMKVLAVDQEASQDSEKPILVRAVTLEISPEQAETLVKATEEGSIQLALRNPLDNQLAPKKEVAAATPPPHVAKRPGKRAYVAAGRTVTIIKGTAATLVRCTPSEC